jgi:ribosomal protein L22
MDAAGTLLVTAQPVSKRTMAKARGGATEIRMSTF